jgi:hypothetical protein
VRTPHPIEQFPDRAGFLKTTSQPAWLRVAFTMRSRIDTERPPASIPTLERMKTKEEIEVDVFTSFAEVSGLLIRRESIVQQNPPLPDILCAQEDGTRVVFELTELVDNGFMRRLGFSTKCKDALRDCLRQELDIADSAHMSFLDQPLRKT